MLHRFTKQRLTKSRQEKQNYKIRTNHLPIMNSSFLYGYYDANFTSAKSLKFQSWSRLHWIRIANLYGQFWRSSSAPDSTNLKGQNKPNWILCNRYMTAAQYKHCKSILSFLCECDHEIQRFSAVSHSSGSDCRRRVLCICSSILLQETVVLY